ncbi:hypothetical protein Sango_2814000 [Sesamum angolense]|uniref:Uncharacterized protein n=1 Tax=Sesamum angolense TaxID=2727404 RepID=A0AAE1VWP2_9LAMI|nr:hypothetical protein Sango_2814000 [Sesamum angolense]
MLSSRFSSSASSSPQKSGLVGWYLGMLKTRPFPPKHHLRSHLHRGRCILPGESSEQYDLIRTLRMAGYGMLILGPSVHYWYNFMSTVFPKRDLLSTLKKMALGQTSYGPTMTVIFFFRECCSARKHLFAKIQHIVRWLSLVFLRAGNFYRRHLNDTEIGEQAHVCLCRKSPAARNKALRAALQAEKHAWLLVRRRRAPERGPGGNCANLRIIFPQGRAKKRGLYGSCGPKIEAFPQRCLAPQYLANRLIPDPTVAPATTPPASTRLLNLGRVKPDTMEAIDTWGGHFALEREQCHVSCRRRKMKLEDEPCIIVKKVES